MNTVVVVNENNLPVEGLQTEVRDRSGKNYEFPDDFLPFPGIYIVMSDKYTNNFSACPKEILFMVRSDSQEVSAGYYITADECKCHC